MEQMMGPSVKPLHGTEAEILAGLGAPEVEHFAYLITLPPVLHLFSKFHFGQDGGKVHRQEQPLSPPLM